MRTMKTHGPSLARLGAMLLLSGCGAVVTTGDAGPAADAVVPADRVTPVDAPGACRFPSGRLCLRGQTCPDDDNCNVCACDLTGLLACTARACVDAGPVTGCRLPNGGTCAVGQSCPAGDGCNTCRCNADGTLACTLIGCIDAGPAACALPDGRQCPRGQTCDAGDGCNLCACDTRGNLACTGRICVDAGPPSCASDRECEPGVRECVFPEAACGARGTCQGITDCATITPYCACDGTTFVACPGRPTQPNLGRGGCASDAGVAPDSAICNGASIGRGGGYCAGPADGPLPIECCTGWVCDQRRAACNSLPPTCPAGWTASVNGACWGPCVPAANCAPIACDSVTACPSGWRCASGTCAYGPR